MANPTDTSGDVVELSSTDGVGFIEQASPLTRLHYFDGQFLRAASFTTEQDYHRHALQLANLAGGWGVVHGLGIALKGDQLAVSPGLAITPNGQLVLAGLDMQAKLTDLLGSAQPPAPGGKAAFGDCLEAKAPTATAATGLQVYEITVGPVEGLCGNEAVFGKLCETACATDSRRPYWREGVVLRLRPVTVNLPDSSAIKAGSVHLRNRVASGYFAQEPGQPGDLLSAAGLASSVWCEPAQLYHRDEVVIGLLWRESGTVRIDAWSGRRERMDTQPRGYWQGRMAMRPWNVFIAQILQFQCQLSGLFDANHPVIQPGDDCGQIRDALGRAKREIEAMLERFHHSAKGLLLKTEGRGASFKQLQDASEAFNASYADLSGLSDHLAKFDGGTGALPQQRMLLNAGFFELPPAGYLPVSTGSDVQEQCRRMFGEGCQLHFHAVHADEIAHLVEEAEHMKRISLTRGLDNPQQREEVEIFVPEGQISSAAAPGNGLWWRTQVDANILKVADLFPTKSAAPGKVDTPPPAPPATPTKAAPQGKAKAQRAQAAAADDIKLDPRREALDQGVALLDGLLRTEARSDGFGFAIAVSLDGALPGRLSHRHENSPLAQRQMLYASGDLAADPFSLGVGGETRFNGELAGLLGGEGGVIKMQGTLTVLTQRVAPNGAQERLVQIDLQASLAPADEGEDSESVVQRLRMVLQRDGDLRSGLLVADDARQDPQTSPVYVEWDDTPRVATAYIEADRLVEWRPQAVNAPGTGDIEVTQMPDRGPRLGNLGARRTLLRTSALPAMPAPDSALGVSVLRTLADLAEINNDAALLMRARKRLFPVLDAPQTETVKAVLDWVMFRRARTHLCGPTCTAPATSAVETFQVWHYQADNAEVLAKLQKALDDGNAKALAAFDFKRVGLLRYRDESAYSEETASQVLQMWTLAKPAARVALGRVWEAAPTAGQGWQNHMRLRHMLEQIDRLTKAPPVGDGSLVAMAPPSGELGDKAVDGGMLVVTLSEQVKVHSHRTVFLPFGSYADFVPGFRQDPVGTLKEMNDFLKRTTETVRDVNAHFAASQLVAADATQLSNADRDLRLATHQGINVRVHHFLVYLKPVDADVQPPAEHASIAQLLKLDMSPAPNGPYDGESVNSAVQDLGGGAQVLSLLGYEDIS